MRRRIWYGKSSARATDGENSAAEFWWARSLRSQRPAQRVPTTQAKNSDYNKSVPQCLQHQRHSQRDHGAWAACFVLFANLRGKTFAKSSLKTRSSIRPILSPRGISALLTKASRMRLSRAAASARISFLFPAQGKRTQSNWPLGPSGRKIGSRKMTLSTKCEAGLHSGGRAATWASPAQHGDCWTIGGSLIASASCSFARSRR